MLRDHHFFQNFGTFFFVYFRVAFAHWTYCLYFHSNYSTHSLYHFEKPAIVATKSYIFIFMHVKPIEVTSGFNLRVMKKSARWLCHTEKSKINTKNKLYIVYTTI